MSDRPRGRVKNPSRSRSRSRSGDRRNSYQPVNHYERDRYENRNRGRQYDNNSNRDSNYERNRYGNERNDFNQTRENQDRQESDGRGYDRTNERGSFRYDRGGRGGDRGRGGGRGGGGGGGSFNRGGPENNRLVPGTTYELYTNYFEVINRPNWIMYQYHVDFEPDIQSKLLKQRLMRQHDNLFENSKAFDGSTIFSIMKLQNNETELECADKDNNVFKVRIRLVNEIYPLSRESFRMFNMIFKRCLRHCGLTEFGKKREYFDFRNLIELNQYNLNIASGYNASMDIYGDRILLCTEVAFKLLNNETVLETFKKLSQRRQNDYKQSCIDYLVGKTVMTNYNNKTYRIDDIDWDKNALDVFEKKNGDRISFVNYYRDNYNINIKEPQAPMLVSKVKNRVNDRNGGKPRTIETDVLLIPELCVITGNVLIKDFNFNDKSQIDQITKLNPQNRYSSLRRFLNKINTNENSKKDLNNWKLDFSEDTVVVNAKIMDNVIIYYNPEKNPEKNSDALWHNGCDWGNSLKNACLLSTINLKNWGIIYEFGSKDCAQFFINKVRELSKNLDFNIDNPIFEIITQRGQSNWANTLKEQISLYKSNNLQMIVCITPDQNKQTYDIIKKICLVDHGISSQVVTSQNLRNDKKKVAVVGKVAIQLNCKLGGEAWGVTLLVSNTMVIGIDLHKNTSDKNKCVAAFVSSMNGYHVKGQYSCTKYFSKCKMQNRNNIGIDCLYEFMTDALNKYLEQNGKKPDKILVYRDGVGDGDLDILIDIEKSALEKAIAEFYIRCDQPKLTIVIVKKRSNSRFFLKNGSNFINPHFGTLIEEKVVKNPGKDFYLVSQSVRNGTVNPTLFNIIHETGGTQNGQEAPCIRIDAVQKITHYLTHLYYNWPGPIRVPAPCHYASKLANLVGESLHEIHSPILDEKLFYL